MSAGVCLGKVVWLGLRAARPPILNPCSSPIRRRGWTAAYCPILPPARRPLSRRPCLLGLPSPAWRQPGPLSCAPPQGFPHKPSPPTKSQCRREGRCYAGRMAARPAGFWAVRSQRSVTRVWLVRARAGRLFNVFAGFEPLPQKEFGEGGRHRLGLGR